MPNSAQILTSAIRDPLRTALDFGGDVDHIVSAAAIDRSALSAGQGTVPLRHFVALNQIAASDLRAPHFGRLAGARFDLANIGSVGQAVLAAPTLGAALRLMERVLISVQGETDMHLVLADGVATLTYRILDPDIWPRDQDAELTIGVFSTLVSSVAGPGWRPVALCFEHAACGADRQRGADPRCPVFYEAETNSVSFEQGLLDRPMPGFDRALFASLSGQLTAKAQRIEQAGSVTARVRRHLFRHMGTPEVDQTSVARSLGLSRRSLRRHLADEDTSFAWLLGECRDDLARGLLKRTQLSIAEIADRLGYSEPSGFERAFRKRTGVTPAGYRRH